MAVVWNIFLPQECLDHHSSYLKGHVDKSRSVIYVTGFSDSPAVDENLVGQWRHQGKQRKPLQAAVQSHQVWLDITLSDTHNLQCHVYLNESSTKPEKCVFVLFSQSELLSSFILSEHIDNEFHVVHQLLHKCRVPEKHTDNARTKGALLMQLCSQCFAFLFTTFLALWTFLFASVDALICFVTFRWLLEKVDIQLPAIASHVGYKLQRHRRVLTSYCHSLQLVLFDDSGQQLLDSLLGVAVMGMVMYSGMADSIAQSVIHWADDTAQNLNDLLHWLMGAPAGLKLNAQLTGYLGHFFLYHVYLWKGYLSVLRPMLGWIMWCAAGSGVLGVTVQLCLIQDILSMLTVHIYCFYVYAARIYSLQVYALSSLWRLFRGKKWNVLRLRVDSALYNMDQLFVGTLLFTVLLFLLPTTALYYFVFASLRLLVLGFHGVLAMFVKCINDTPACTLLLRVLRSKAVTGDIMFTVTDGEVSDNSLVLSMQTTHLPIPKLYKWAQEHLRAGVKEKKKYTWTDLLHRLATGSLIYPWVVPSDSDTTSASQKEKIL